MYTSSIFIDKKKINAIVSILTGNIATMEALLKDNNFGYNHAEALYCRKYGNIPNSVFPIFWWKQYKDGSPRSPLFVRVQHGY